MDNRISLFFVVLAIGFKIQAYEHDHPHECVRECQRNSTPKTCVYRFDVEWFRTLSKGCWDCPVNITHCSLPHCVTGDGFKKYILTINKQLPGPPIEVCEGDTIVVYLTNNLEDGATVTLHWHGVHMRGTQYMDGVPMLTQCPVLPGNTFRYEFKADPVGTHWYHAHTGVQRADGLLGPLIIRQPRDQDVHSALYDYDLPGHTVTVMDWYQRSAMTRFLHENRGNFEPFLPMSGLINGKTRKYKVQLGDQSAYTPTTVFHVQAGSKYRFRMIAATGDQCQFRISIDKHQLTAITADGAAIKPVQADTISIAPGERYDVVVSADQAVGNYWMRAYCSKVGFNILAIVRYEGAPEELPTEPEDTFVNTGTMLLGEKLKGDDQNARYIAVGELESVYDEDFSNEKVDMHYSMKLDMNHNDNSRYNHEKYYPVTEINGLHLTPLINNISFVHADVPLLSQWNDRNDSWFCNKSTINNTRCHKELCRCTHMVELPFHKVAEVTFVNLYTLDISANHFMHTHGYYFRVMANGVIGKNVSVELVERMRQTGEIKLRYKNPIYRDTATVERGGYMIIRIKANNPGLWLFHCHRGIHNVLGQGLIFKVGNVADLEPPENFPRCGSYGTSDAPDVCPFLSGEHCRDRHRFCKQFPVRDCYHDDTRNICCETCKRYHTGIRGCEYGDKYYWCRYSRVNNCRRYPLSCCHTCRYYGRKQPFRG